MKMPMNEFVKRQDEFQGHKIRLKIQRNDGNINYTERLVNDRFCEPSGDFFTVLEVEILEKIGITTIGVKDGKMVLKSQF